jgi:hypothetical protein
MAYHYSSLKRERSAHALPEIEVFAVSAYDFLTAPIDTWMDDAMQGFDGGIDSERGRYASEIAGWYYWYCTPGCLPDSEGVYGPYKTEDEALADAREGYGNDEEDEGDDDDE